jgi:hypothetical protein
MGMNHRGRSESLFPRGLDSATSTCIGRGGFGRQAAYEFPLLDGRLGNPPPSNQSPRCTSRTEMQSNSYRAREVQSFG